MLWTVIKVINYVLVFLFLLSFGVFLARTENTYTRKQNDSKYRGNDVNNRRS